MRLLHGDSLVRLRELGDASVDSVVTDPPYGLAFMNKHWDYDVPTTALWREVLRVLKPGGHLLSFGGTRTYHRMVVAIEDAGFEIRDQVQWIYGSGFPKSQDVSKAIDKQAGAEREIVGVKAYAGGHVQNSTTSMVGDNYGRGEKSDADQRSITAPATDAAKAWQGWGTALKPANEPIVLARKPLEHKLTVAANVLKYGTGAINVDASRIGYASEAGQGRWPANVLFDEEAAAMLDEQSGVSKSTGGKRGASENFALSGSTGARANSANVGGLGDSGGASRFFYVAKASKRERNAGLEGMPQVKLEDYANGTKRKLIAQAEGPKNPNLPRANHHPTVKPIKLMEYLIRLITPPAGTVLDPFLGSGTTGVTAKRLGYSFIGIELDEQYFEIAKKRIEQSGVSEVEGTQPDPQMEMPV